MDLLLERLSKNESKLSEKKAVAFIVPERGTVAGKIEKEFTYKEVEEITTSLAHFLLEKGLKKGDRALLVYPPSLDFMLAFLACLKAGVIAVPVFPPNPTRKDTLIMFSRITESCGAEFALTNNSYNHIKKIAGIRDTFTKFTRQNASWPEQLKWVETNDAKAKTTTNELSTPVPTDIAFLQYTSGSTSEPKGVMITHGNLAHNLTIITNELEAIDDTIVASWLPQYHDMGLIGSYLGILYCGGTGYYMSPLSFLQRPMLWIEAVSKYKATHLQAPNFAFKLTARKFNANSHSTDDASTKLDLKSVRHVINAAEPVDEESIQSFMNAFGQFGFQNVIYPTYGLAEHTVFVCSGGKQTISVNKTELEVNGRVVIEDSPTDSTTTNGEGSDNNNAGISRLVGCGYPSRQNVDVRIVNPETLIEVQHDTVGEIWVQSPSKAAGYYMKDKETQEEFHAKILVNGEEEQAHENNNEYLRTGDLGFLFNGELFICGRLKDLIIVGGRNYYPQDIETTAESSASEQIRPGCSAAFTIDPTHEGGEEVALIMELREVPKNEDEKQSKVVPLADQVRSLINAEHSLAISQILFLRPKTVPKTSSGKIARAWCRKAYVGGRLDVIYQKSFKSMDQKGNQLEIKQGGTNQEEQAHRILTPEKIDEIRNMSREEILGKLLKEISMVGSIPEESINKGDALVTMLDSMTISQFKGLLESGYAVDLSDEYLFRETTTIQKLVEVVKLGYAADDDDGTGPTGGGGHIETVSTGKADGIAGALGCPPGVVCCTIQ